MAKCEMYRVEISGPVYGLLCGNCGGLTLDVGTKACPHCGAEVAHIEDDGDSFAAWGGLRYAHDVGFDEGYQAAMEEVDA